MLSGGPAVQRPGPDALNIGNHYFLKINYIWNVIRIDMISRSAIFGALAALACAPLWATVFTLPEDGSAVVGEDAHIQSHYKDTLLDIARRYSLGYEEIIRANPGTDMWIPGEGKDIFLPGRRILPPGPGTTAAASVAVIE